MRTLARNLQVVISKQSITQNTDGGGWCPQTKWFNYLEGRIA